jgi:YD repeat-containing protein
MKTLPSKLLAITILVFGFTGCNDDFWNELRGHKGRTKVLVQEMVHNGRHYEFVYDKKGLVDYIDVPDPGYRYEVTYKGKKLFSAQLIENGEVVSENHNFKLDKKGNIIEYTYSWYSDDIPGGYHNVHTMEYDERNRLISVTSDGGTKTFSYNDHGDVTSMSTSTYEATYTYDSKINPLNLVPDLFFIVVEEPFLWEFILSTHNSETRTESPTVNHPQGLETIYTNEYDSFLRLIRKTDGGEEGFTFLYEK